jgi:hypothetical protein
LTERKSFVSNSELFSFRFAEYGTFLKENKAITGMTDARRVERNKIKLAAEKYLNF